MTEYHTQGAVGSDAEGTVWDPDSGEAENLLLQDKVGQSFSDKSERVRGYSDSRVEPFHRTHRLIHLHRWLPFYKLKAKSTTGAPNISEQSREMTNRSLCAHLSVLTLSVICVFLLGFVTGNTVLKKTEEFWPDWDKAGQPGQYLAHYPTDFTRDVLPVPCHSHNDYWRRIPLFLAVHHGCTSIEADVWLFGDDLFVGHDLASLTANRTFRSLYINPLVEILDRQNSPETTKFGKDNLWEKNGVFDEQPFQSLVLLVDIKTGGRETFKEVQAQLEPLREKGYLTYFNGKETVPGPVIVVGTGATPFESVIANDTYRDIFADAPLELFSLKSPSPETSKYSKNNSYYASTSMMEEIGYPWRGHYTEKQVAKIRDQIEGAQKAGLVTRYWETPSWPVGLRNHVWTMLVKEGVDILNVDDLKAATQGRWGRWD